MSEPIIICKDVHKWYGNFHALRGINMEVQPGEVIVIFGPSGSGKSTFIRTINRLEQHQYGQIIVDGIELTADVSNVEKIREETGMVFQQFNLFPHLSVMENITLAPIQVKKVAIARALAMDPKVMLFDEPTSALDPEMIKEVLDVMVELAKEGMTMLVVSHEMGFARGVADRLYFFDAGMVVESGAPKELFENPQEPRTKLFLSQIISH